MNNFVDMYVMVMSSACVLEQEVHVGAQTTTPELLSHVWAEIEYWQAINCTMWRACCNSLT
jgi:hypothetical protein